MRDLFSHFFVYMMIMVKYTSMFRCVSSDNDIYWNLPDIATVSQVVYIAEE